MFNPCGLMQNDGALQSLGRLNVGAVLKKNFSGCQGRGQANPVRGRGTLAAWHEIGTCGAEFMPRVAQLGPKIRHLFSHVHPLVGCQVDQH